jgi:hypothetical protein
VNSSSFLSRKRPCIKVNTAVGKTGRDASGEYLKFPAGKGMVYFFRRYLEETVCIILRQMLLPFEKRADFWSCFIYHLAKQLNKPPLFAAANT